MRIKPLVALLFWILEFDDVRRTHSFSCALSSYGALGKFGEHFRS